ncbi:unnamed protein product [Rhizoctonia solani]|uniref:Uncharacterized protein n=1 Tax=Rhizoctonia solani TaxID=456999 RepID=A0A8H3DK31_9AGAM|nr:unnamed protein product [Rhizoctonia solani]
MARMQAQDAQLEAPAENITNDARIGNSREVAGAVDPLLPPLIARFHLVSVLRRSIASHPSLPSVQLPRRVKTRPAE